ncbi:MAG TPA: DMT family transporter [Candidatus Saccharimonadia bacterium]|nr:DMT family transporter [Candidatus Saccharimonadia bacterium]
MAGLDRRNENLGGILWMLAGVGALSLMDACLKTLAPHYPAMQVAALRGLSALPIVLAYVAWRRRFASVLRVRWGLHLFRGAMAIAMLAAFSFALRELPLTEAYAIFFVAPLIITALSAPVLGERVGRARWAAIAAGMLGVLVVLRPTGEGIVSLAGLAVLAAATGYALSAITVRVLARTDSIEAMVFWLTTMLAIGATALSASRWVPVTPAHYPVLVALAVTGAFGQYAITAAFRRGEASVVAPFEYSALAWGLVLDFVFWGVLPDPIVYAGAAILVASGIYLVHRERAERAEAPA